MHAREVGGHDSNENDLLSRFRGGGGGEGAPPAAAASDDFELLSAPMMSLNAVRAKLSVA